MLDIATLEIGDKVCYTEPNSKKTQNGKIKEIPDFTNSAVRVVYNCGGDWANFQEYTSQLTDIKDLTLGWKH